MNRAQFFQGIFALLGFGQAGTITISPPQSFAKCYEKSPVQDVFVPCGSSALKAGEERCPLGHAQEPLEAGFLMAGWINGNGFDGYPPAVIRTRRVHVCGVCSIMYAVHDVQQEKK